MKLYCPNCLSKLSKQEVKKKEMVVACYNCRTVSNIFVAENVTTQYLSIEKDKHKKDKNLDIFAHYPVILPSFRLKALEADENGEKVLRLEYAHSRLNLFTAILNLASILAFMYICSLPSMRSLLFSFLSGNENAIMTIAIGLTISFALVIQGYNTLFYFLRAFVPEKVKILQGKLIYTSIWGREKTYFEAEIENIYPNIKIKRRYRGGDKEISVLSLELGENQKLKNIFDNIPENEARWAVGRIKKYLQQTSLGNNE